MKFHFDSEHCINHPFLMSGISSQNTSNFSGQNSFYSIGSLGPCATGEQLVEVAGAATIVDYVIVVGSQRQVVVVLAPVTELLADEVEHEESRAARETRVQASNLKCSLFERSVKCSTNDPMQGTTSKNHHQSQNSAIIAEIICKSKNWLFH